MNKIIVEAKFMLAYNTSIPLKFRDKMMTEL